MATPESPTRRMQTSPTAAAGSSSRNASLSHSGPRLVPARRHEAVADVATRAATETAAQVPAEGSIPQSGCPWCKRKHAGQCLRSALIAAMRVFVCSYGLKAGLTLVLALLKGRLSPWLVARTLLSSDNIRFGAFLGSLCGVVRIVRCLLARLRGVDDKWNAAAAGALSGLTIALDSPSRRWSVASYMVCRAIYSFTHTGMRVGMLPRIQHSNKYLYALAATGILYAFLHEPALLDDTYYAFMTRVSGVPHEVLSWTFMHYDKPGALVHGKPCVQTHPTLPLQNLDINSALRFREREPGCLNEQSVEALRSVAYAACPKSSSHNTLLTSPPPTSHDVRELRPYSRLFPHPKWMHAGLVGQAQDPLAFRECSILYHPEGGCLESHVRQIPSLVKSCARVYVPVHLLPLLALRLPQVIKSPVATLSKTAVAIANSTAFLSSSVLLIRLTLCTLRNYYRQDKWWFGPVTGIVSSAGLCFENSHRVSELMLYCMPKFLYIAFIALERRGLVRRVPGAHVWIFAIAMGLLLTVDRRDYAPGQAGLLKFLFGEDTTSFATITSRLARGVPLENLAEQAAGAAVDFMTD